VVQVVALVVVVQSLAAQELVGKAIMAVVQLVEILLLLVVAAVAHQPLVLML
jgi:hypothetical protein